MTGKKWKLQCSGRHVETVLYQYGKDLINEHLCHSFIIDPWDKSYRTHEVFSEAEIREIKDYNQKPMAKMPEELHNYLMSFGKVTTFQQARDLIFTRQTWDHPFDRAKSFDLDWVRSSFYHMVQELEAGDVGSYEHSEAWLIGRIWSVVDKAFDNLLHAHLDRGENACKSSSLRKNRNRIPQGMGDVARKRMGRRLDMIIRRKKVELGGGEAGKNQDESDLKLLRERDLKLPKALKDMLCAAVVGLSPENMNDVVMTGVLQYGMFAARG
ncbi:hypothetical protein BX666DRAFT_1868045 [Dichotomocladium elegans]|nr:hypothetical protein BX666DRAFT_1868045 [Dichotomocladium elegans]